MLTKCSCVVFLGALSRIGNAADDVSLLPCHCPFAALLTRRVVAARYGPHGEVGMVGSEGRVFFLG